MTLVDRAYDEIVELHLANPNWSQTRIGEEAGVRSDIAHRVLGRYYREERPSPYEKAFARLALEDAYRLFALPEHRTQTVTVEAGATRKPDILRLQAELEELRRERKRLIDLVRELLRERHSRLMSRTDQTTNEALK